MLILISPYPVGGGSLSGQSIDFNLGELQELVLHGERAQALPG